MSIAPDKLGIFVDLFFQELKENEIFYEERNLYGLWSAKLCVADDVLWRY